MKTIVDKRTPDDPGRGSVPPAIGKYTITELIRHGGMSSVYRAEMPGPGGARKPVALKLGAISLDERMHLSSLFLDEMRLTMAMTHRNLVQTIDAGEFGGRYYLVMELVQGCSLRELMAARRWHPLPLAAAVFIGMEVCAGLDYVHTLRDEGAGVVGIVHQDVCPSNILLSEHGDVKLADFGVARAIDRINASHPGLVIGKPSYMAPEQASGRTGPANDLFSLGAVLFECISGVPLRRRASVEEARQFSGPILGIRELGRDIPASLDELVTRCLAPTAAERPPTAAALRGELAEEYAKLDPPARDAHQALSDLVKGVRDELPRLRRSEGEEIADALDKQLDALSELSVGTRSRHATASPCAAQAVKGSARSGRRGLLVATGVFVAVVATMVLTYFLVFAPSRAKELAGAPVDSGAKGLPPDAVVEPEANVDKAPARAGAQRARAKRRPRASRGKGRQGRSGRLFLNTEPWTHVYVDGKHWGTTPIQGRTIPAGKRRIRLVNKEAKINRTIRLRIRPGETTRRGFDLRTKK